MVIDQFANKISVSKYIDKSINMKQATSLAKWIIHIEKTIKELKTIKHQYDLSNTIESQLVDLSIREILSYYIQNKQYDEAIWLAFLMVSFGEIHNRSPKSTEVFYKNRSLKTVFTWQEVKANAEIVNQRFNHLLQENVQIKFGNHRKYEGIDRARQTLADYIQWVNLDHQTAFAAHSQESQQNHFARLYNELSCIHRFGRLAKFDFLTFIEYLELVNIISPHGYITQSTGPKIGAQKLFGYLPNKQLEKVSSEFADEIGVSYHVLEDALCNWQKSLNNDQYSKGCGDQQTSCVLNDGYC